MQICNQRIARIPGWGREESRKTSVREQVTKRIHADNSWLGKGTVPEKSRQGTGIPNEL
jgi:hypothetical protein